MLTSWLYIVDTNILRSMSSGQYSVEPNARHLNDSPFGSCVSKDCLPEDY